MKSCEIKCDVCVKTKKSNDNEELNIDLHNSNDDLLMITKEDRQTAVAKCIDCNFNLCSNCLLDHHLISAYSSHQIYPLNTNTFINAAQNNNNINNVNKNQPILKSNFQLSNIAQLQQQYNNLEDQLLIKRKQQTQQQQQQQQQQTIINQRIVQIESEIQKSYNFYVQMLKERRDYLVNELNTIVQYAIQNHQQNYNKQLKLKTEIEQKKQSLEIAEAVASAIAASSENSNKSNTSPLHHSYDHSHDNNNNKISASLNELNGLALINNQMLQQLKNTNPLTSIEFVSNFSTIQTSIRNTFGYIRINNQLNSNSNGTSNAKVDQSSMGFGNLPIYDYLMKSNELSVMCDLDSTSSASSNPLSYNSDYLNTVNTLSGSSNGSNKTSSSSTYNKFINGNKQETGSIASLSSSASSGNSIYSNIIKNDFNNMSEWPGSIGESNKSTNTWSAIINNLNKDDESEINEQKSNLMSLSSKSVSTSSFGSFKNSKGSSIGMDDCSPTSSSSSTHSELNYDMNNTTLTTVLKSSNVSSNIAITNSGRPQLKRSKMIYHCKFGEFGVNDGQFTEPSGVTVNVDNDIVVADTNSHRIQIFDKEGRFKFKFGECGKRDGQLLYPNRVSVVKSTGDIVVTERSPTHQIQIYNKYGQFMRKFGANILQHPRGVCVDSKGRIIVVECKVMRVLIFDLMGNVLQKFNCAKYLEFPNGVCCSNSGDREEIYISDNRAHCIKVFDYNGNFIRQIGGEGITNYPIGVGINSNNEILVADNHNNFNLTVFTQDGLLINALESKVKHAQCFDVGLMDDGSIVLASKDYRIYVYKYTNNSLTLSNSVLDNFGDINLNDINDDNTSNQMQTNIYDLFSPPSHFNPILSTNLLGKSYSSDNLIDSMPNFNSLLL